MEDVNVTMSFFEIGALSALISSVYLFYRGVRKKANLCTAARVVYCIVSVIFLYYCIIYSLVIAGVFTPINYAPYLWSIASLITLSPTFIALVHRDK